MTDEAPTDLPWGIDPAASRRVFFGMLALIAGAVIAYAAFRPPAAPPPAAIAGDSLLVEGRRIYLARCATCHGESGRGDGAIAKNLAGPPVGNLTDSTWKHGDKPEQVMDVIARGAPGTAMQGWGSTLEEPGVRAAAAYVYYLAGRKVPEALRRP